MQQSESTKELDTALGKAQAECKPVVKNKINPFFKNKSDPNKPTYADLEAIGDAAKEALERNSLVWHSYPLSDGLMCRITHVLSGEWRSWVSPYHLTKDSIQDLGSSITYLRRYNKACVLDLVAEDDDDGNLASGAAAPGDSAPRAPVKATEKAAVVRPSASKKTSSIYEGKEVQKESLSKIFHALGISDTAQKNTIHKTLINWKVAFEKEPMIEAVTKIKKMMENGEEIMEIPF